MSFNSSILNKYIHTYIYRYMLYLKQNHSSNKYKILNLAIYLLKLLSYPVKKLQINPILYLCNIQNSKLLKNSSDTDLEY